VLVPASRRAAEAGDTVLTPARPSSPTDGAGLRVGTSGWHYADWWGPFYPREVRKKDALAYYATRFTATELNAPFYRMPGENAVRAWREGVPEGFRFAWKASRYITHFKRLLVSDDSLELLEARVSLLGDKAGPILFQLHPQMRQDRDRLASFLKRLPKRRRYSVEFRHESWYAPTVLDLLADHDVSLCLSDHADAPAPREATANWVYVRLHGPGGRYRGSYGDDALADWAKAIVDWRAAGREVWCFFDNDVKSAAPADADRLLARLSWDREPAPPGGR
jgi:uncharacterized protein YecE (DUF72 family)